MFVPADVVKAFAKPASNPKRIDLFTPTDETSKRLPIPVGCDPKRSTILICKPKRNSRARWVTAHYKRTSPETQESVKLSKFEIFNNPTLWS